MMENLISSSQETIKVLLGVIQELEKGEAHREGYVCSRLSYDALCRLITLRGQQQPPKPKSLTRPKPAFLRTGCSSLRTEQGQSSPRLFL